MGHQYSSASSYNTQYPPVSPFYSPFAPAAGQQISNGTPPNFQQQNLPANLPLPDAVPNAVRYDTNAQIHAHSAQLPFAPPFNPEFLKHFPPPIPPPPIPPTARFTAAPGPTLGYPFPPPLNPPQNQASQSDYPYHPQTQKPLSADHAPSPNLGLMQEVQFQNTTSPAQGVNASAEQAPRHVAEEVSSANTLSAQPTGGTTRGNDHISALAPNPFFDGGTTRNDSKQRGLGSGTDVIPYKVDGPLVNGHQRPQLNTSTTILQPASEIELRERAKAALLSLAPHNIRYDEFLAEGVDAHVLQQLYSELGLSWRALEDKSQQTIPDSLGPVLQRSGLSKPKDQAANIPSLRPTNNTTVDRVSPVVSSGMERKDRIAQLLAAKAGKASNSGIISKSQSPAPVISSTNTTAVEPESMESSSSTSATQIAKPTQTFAQAGFVKQRMEQIKNDTTIKAQVAQSLDGMPDSVPNGGYNAMDTEAYQIKLSASLPTPIREHLVQNGFASIIPGLFMTSADPAEEPSVLDQGPSQVKDNTPSPARFSAYEVQPAQLSQVLQKRPIDRSLGQEDHRQIKRRAVAEEQSADSSMEVDDASGGSASEGEIIEEDPSARLEHQETLHSSFVAAQQAEPGPQVYPNQRSEADTVRRPTAEADLHKLAQRSQNRVATSNGSATATPISALAPQTILSSPLSKFPDPNAVNLRTDDRPEQNSMPFVKATPEQIAEKAARLKAEFLRQRALRQKRPQGNTVVPNDDVAKAQTRLQETKSQLAEVRKELEECETRIVRTRAAEGQLVQEVERLEKQISEVGLNPKLNSEEHDTPKPSSSDSVQPLPTRRFDTDQLRLGARLTSVSSDEPSNIPTGVQDPRVRLTDTHAQPTQSAESRTENPPTQENLQGAIASQEQERPQLATLNEDGGAKGSAVETASNHKRSILPMTADPSEQQSQPTIDQNEKSDEAMDESDEESDDSRMSIDEETDDSASMSDGGSDEYEPAEPELSHNSDEKTDSEEYEPGIDESQPQERASADGDEDYEPADDYGQVEDYRRAEFSEDSATTDNVLTPSTTALTGSAYERGGNALDQVPSISHIAENLEPSRIDDMEKGLQLSEADTFTKPQKLPTDEETDGPHVLGAIEPSPVRYVPYQSPLSTFKSYRFHPLFSNSVKDGYRSLTYSHKIDPKLPFCPTELAGAVCTDPGCSSQHFSSMALTDDKILVQMSSANDIKDKQVRDQYLLGLKSVIARLRQEGVKEFVAVADALSQYRRDWTAAQTGY